MCLIMPRMRVKERGLPLESLSGGHAPGVKTVRAPERKGRRGDVDGGEALRSAEIPSRDQEFLVPEALP